MARRRDGEPGRQRHRGAKPAAAKAKPKASAAKPAPATQGEAEAEAGGRAAAAEGAPPTTARPRAVRSGSPSLDAAKKPHADRAPRAGADARPKGTELVTTAVQATGELAKIGLTLGGQALKRAVDRLPKP